MMLASLVFFFFFMIQGSFVDKNMLIFMSLGFNKGSFWEALIQSLCASEEVNILTRTQLLFPSLLSCF